MGRKMVIASVAAATAGLCIWVSSDPILYSQPLSPKHKLTIRSSRAADPDQLNLTITYHYPPAIFTYMAAEQTVKRPNEALTFSLVVDHDNDLQCIYDNNDIGFLLLYHAPSDDLWDTTGRIGGWNGTDKAVWQRRLHELQQKFPSIPYSLLPN
jgi:hypothetical protein